MAAVKTYNVRKCQKTAEYREFHDNDILSSLRRKYLTMTEISTAMNLVSCGPKTQERL